MIAKPKMKSTHYLDFIRIVDEIIAKVIKGDRLRLYSEINKYLREKGGLYPSPDTSVYPFTVDIG